MNRRWTERSFIGVVMRFIVLVLIGMLATSLVADHCTAMAVHELLGWAAAAAKPASDVARSIIDYFKVRQQSVREVERARLAKKQAETLLEKSKFETAKAAELNQSALENKLERALHEKKAALSAADVNDARLQETRREQEMMQLDLQKKKSDIEAMYLSKIQEQTDRIRAETDSKVNLYRLLTLLVLGFASYLFYRLHHLQRRNHATLLAPDLVKTGPRYITRTGHVTTPQTGGDTGNAAMKSNGKAEPAIAAAS
uniref:Uncharacterized protein n=1 Tax=Spongospora subterranea TaxID=70186 RepID=A0A0H5RCS7_9EUKA|eukprot:CRZ11803.1 hypothetical protein [Spongospora subterranea]